MKKVNKTFLFITSLYVFEAVCLLCIALLSYDQIGLELISILPFKMPFVKALLKLFFVLMLANMLWLATDRFTYLLGVFIRFIRCKKEGLKNIYAEPTDFITFMGQTIIIGSLAMSSLCLSLHFTTSGAASHLSSNYAGDMSQSNFGEISNKFQLKENEIEKKYSELKAIEQKKYNRMVSYRAVELAQEAINELEKSKQKELQDIRIQRDREIQELKESQLNRKEFIEAQKKTGDYIGLSFELLAICCSIAIQVLQRGEFLEKNEISKQNYEEISNEKSQDFEKTLAEYYQKVKEGKLKQYEVAKILNVSPVKISRLFKNMKKPINKEYNIGDNFF